MFTAFGNVLGRVFGNEVPDTNTEQSAKHSDATDNDFDEMETVVGKREFEGQVTHLFDKHGLIDNEVYFSLEHVVGGVRPSLHDKVSVVATQHHAGGGWHASQVTLCSADWDNVSDTPSDVDDDDAYPAQVVGNVTDTSGDTGYVNNHIYYDTSECEMDDYRPCKGDWVKVEVIYDHDADNETRTIAKARRISPLRVKETDGIISGLMEDHGYIDGEVFYMAHEIQGEYRPRRWDPVHYKAVESQQGRCSWRAISIQPSLKPKITSLKVLQGPLQQSFTKELLSDKEGISITKETDFGSVVIGNHKTMTIWVKNAGSVAQVFNRCHIAASSSQIQIKNIKLLKEHQAMLKTGCNDKITGNVTLYPGMMLYVNVQIDARVQGQEKHLMIFTFEGFKIGRYITGHVTDPMVDMLDRNDPYISSRRQGYDKYRDTVENKAQPWLVPGERPNRNKKTVQYPHRLPQYEVPVDLREIVLYNEDLLQYAPVLDQELCFTNYRDKFKHLLHLEEIQMDIDIREFDLHRVCLRHVGEFMGLKVPGLAEGRPSVLLGDKVTLTDPGDPHGPSYEGYVHQLLKDEVLLKFNPDFHTSYTGKDYDVVFSYNRGPLRKCHRSTEMAHQLGKNVLFPGHFVPKPSQYNMNHQQGQSHLTSLNQSSSKVKRSNTTFKYFNTKLNRRQRSAVERIVQGQGRPLPYILFGPPGTGKTVTVVEAILQTFVKLPASRIIVCTPSNSAADLVAERLHESGQVSKADMVRLNALQRSEESICESISGYCSVGDDIDLASRYRILVTTCVSAGVLYTLGIKAGHFTHVFIDEAGQATEPESMISACLVSSTEGQIVLAGDPQQLGPVLRSKFTRQYGLQVSLLERLMCTQLYQRDEHKFADHGAYDPLLKYVWVKQLAGVPKDVMWPAKVISTSDDFVDLYIKSDNAELRVKKQNTCTFNIDGLPSLKHRFQCILGQKKRKAAAMAFE